MFCEFMKRLGRECLADNIVDVGAMMAFYAVLALFPLLIFGVTISLLVLPEGTLCLSAHLRHATH